MGTTTRYRSLTVTLLALAGILLSGCKGGGISSVWGGSSATPVANHASRPLAATPTTGLYAWGSGHASAAMTSTTSTTTSTPTSTTGSVTLSWTPPTQNTDGSTLTNLAGYYVDYGTQSGNYTNSIQLSNPGLSSYVVQNLAAGTYYFAVTAYNSDGSQSPYSQQVSVSVQ